MNGHAGTVPCRKRGVSYVLLMVKLASSEANRVCRDREIGHNPRLPAVIFDITAWPLPSISPTQPSLARYTPHLGHCTVYATGSTQLPRRKLYVGQLP